MNETKWQVKRRGVKDNGAGRAQRVFFGRLGGEQNDAVLYLLILYLYLYYIYCGSLFRTIDAVVDIEDY